MRFVDLRGILQRGRRFPSGAGSVQQDDVKDPAKLAEIIRQLQKRLSDVEAKTPPEAVEFEVNVGAGGTLVTLAHNLKGPVRWYVVLWTQVGGTATPNSGPSLVQDASSTSQVLALRSYQPGKAVVRVEPAFAGVDPGQTVTVVNRAPVWAAITADTTNTGAGAYVDLMSTTVTTVAANSFLVIQFSASFTKLTALGVVHFQVQVNGVAAPDATMTNAALNQAENATLQVRMPVQAGTHTVLVRWASVPNSAAIRPATNASEFASMYIQETT